MWQLVIPKGGSVIQSGHVRDVLYSGALAAAGLLLVVTCAVDRHVLRRVLAEQRQGTQNLLLSSCGLVAPCL